MIKENAQSHLRAVVLINVVPILMVMAKNLNKFKKKKIVWNLLILCQKKAFGIIIDITFPQENQSLNMSKLWLKFLKVQEPNLKLIVILAYSNLIEFSIILSFTLWFHPFNYDWQQRSFGYSSSMLWKSSSNDSDWSQSYR